jgi:hypothetical protein
MLFAFLRSCVWSGSLESGVLQEAVVTYILLLHVAGCLGKKKYT